MTKRRVDQLLVERGLFDSREKARAAVMAGTVRVDGMPAPKPGMMVHEEAKLEVLAPPAYVSRGGEKLAHALRVFGIDVSGRVAVDIGASTGGFTDCLRKAGARRIYAVDVGYGQLDYRLRQDPRVVVMERVNARYLDRLPEPVDVATVDVSFISLEKILPTVHRLLRPGGDVVALVKPQFEAGRQEVGRGGIVRDPQVHAKVIGRVVAWAVGHGFRFRGLTTSPIRGAEGNKEFLLWLTVEKDDEP